MGLQEYRRKRNFRKTPEPTGGKSSKKHPLFVVQEHWASHLHYDFRLEAFGTLKSWAVPKGPSTKIGDKRLAVEVEDHPISYAGFHGRIPEGQYGAGTVKIWDKGTWIPPENLRQSLKSGHLEFELKGHKLKGRWLLQRTRQTSGKKSQWLLIKRHDPSQTQELNPATRGQRAALPPVGDISPQLAQLHQQVPQGMDWIYEVKFDGYRTFAHLQRKTVKLITRRGLDWTHKYIGFDQELKKLGLKSAILDGEMVALDGQGRSHFSALQNALQEMDMRSVVYYVFDLLFLNGRDLRNEPLEIRKQILKKILPADASAKIRFSEHIRAQGDELLQTACKQGLEGIIAKNRRLPYRAGRSDSWQKIKCSNRQEFVIGGYTDPAGSRQALGALLVGVFEKKGLRYVGRVGTGFNSKTLQDIKTRLQDLSLAESPFDIAGPKGSSKIHWVKPVLLAEVEFAGWTGDQILRHAVFQGLREDKMATEVVREKISHRSKKPRAKTTVKESKNETTSSFHITHPDRVVYPESETTKLDVANYYRSVAPWLLPHLANRPLALVRCPDQAGEHCFFQKHVDHSKMTAVNEALIREQKVISLQDEEGLLQLVQWGVLELHTWQCHIQNPESVDQLIFDLDPDPSIKWKQIVDVAFRLKELFEKISMKSFVKLTGGKGLHVHVPVAPVYTWEQTKAFCKTVCQQLESETPQILTTQLAKKKRGGKIFLDYLRNGFGATAVCAYSLRSKDKPLIAIPITWDELRGMKKRAEFDMESVMTRLASARKEVWPQYHSLQQEIQILGPVKAKRKSKA